MPQRFVDIFLENTMQVFFLPLGQSVTFEAMYWFGLAGIQEAAMLMLGALAGGTLNWLFGLGLAKLRLRRQEFFSNERFERLGTLFRRYGVWLVVFYWAPFGTLAVVLAGFFAARLPLVAALVLAGTLLRLHGYFPGALG